MDIIPINGYVLIKEADAIVKESSLSTFVLPEGHELETKNQGKVVKLPPTDPMANKIWFQEGDYVFFKRHAFDEIDGDGEKLLLGKIDNVIAVIIPRKTDDNETRTVKSSRRK